MNNKTEAKDIKSADAFENGIRTEYERITEESVNLETLIRNHLREAKEQAGRIVVWIDLDKIDNNKLLQVIESARQWDSKRKIKEIYLYDKQGKEIKI